MNLLKRCDCINLPDIFLQVLDMVDLYDHCGMTIMLLAVGLTFKSMHARLNYAINWFCSGHPSNINA